VKPVAAVQYPTILFVDDDPLLLEGLTRTLRREPYDIRTAASAKAALAILSAVPVAVVVSDEQMPGGSGADLLERVRESYPDVVRIILTGKTDLQATMRLIQEGALYRFLSKPLQDEDLKRTLRQALQMKRLNDASERLSK
jgi:DNA-binding NtrC family response regulator